MRALRLRAAAAGLAGVALASLARADAPGDQYDYFSSADQTIRDLHTNLLWERYPAAVPLDYASALDHCARLSIGGIGGTWRVPSYKELLTIVDEAPHTEYENGTLVSKAIDANAFPQTPVTAYDWWTSSPTLQANAAYAIDFSTGQAYALSTTPGKGNYVRCVQYVGP